MLSRTYRSRSEFLSAKVQGVAADGLADSLGFSVRDYLDFGLHFVEVLCTQGHKWVVAVG